MRTNKEEVFADLSRETGAGFVNEKLKYMAEFFNILAKEQSEAAEKLERHTRRLVWLTWTLLILTAILLFHEIIVNKNAYTKCHHDQVTDNHKPVKP